MIYSANFWFGCSGERKPLWLCEAERDASASQHGGSPWPNARSSLWTVPPLQAGGDGLQGHRFRQPVLQVRRGQSTAYIQKLICKKLLIKHLATQNYTQMCINHFVCMAPIFNDILTTKTMALKIWYVYPWWCFSSLLWHTRESDSFRIWWVTYCRC